MADVSCGANELAHRQLEALEAVKAEIDLLFDLVDARHQFSQDLWKVRVHAEESLAALRAVMGYPTGS